jgi:toxin-antitoxin system PIN domain toxin
VIHLLDVNVLVALFDPAHLFHDAAHSWFEAHGRAGWATCPLTENGFVRVLSNPAYPGRRTTAADATERLRRFTASGGHAFWPDDLSVLDESVIAPDLLSGHREITDTYLLALALRNWGRLATFDQKLRTDPVLGAKPDHIVVVPVR